MSELDRLAISQIIVRPVVSEKSYALMDDGVYTFLVRPEANKAQIRKAVELTFDVKVERVNTARLKPKRVRNLRTGQEGRKPQYKKAYVKLAAGQKIEAFEELKG